MNFVGGTRRDYWVQSRQRAEKNSAHHLVIQTTLGIGSIGTGRQIGRLENTSRPAPPSGRQSRTIIVVAGPVVAAICDFAVSVSIVVHLHHACAIARVQFAIRGICPS